MGNLPNNLIVELNGEKVSVTDFTAIDENQLSQEFSKQASLMAYVGHLVAEAESDYTMAKVDREILEAELDATCREILDKQSVKYTETKIRGMVTIDEGRIKAVEEESAALEQYKKLRSLADAVRQRGDMLISLGALVRAEADLTGATIKQTLKDLHA